VRLSARVAALPCGPGCRFYSVGWNPGQWDVQIEASSDQPACQPATSSHSRCVSFPSPAVPSRNPLTAWPLSCPDGGRKGRPALPRQPTSELYCPGAHWARRPTGCRCARCRSCRRRWARRTLSPPGTAAPAPAVAQRPPGEGSHATGGWPPTAPRTRQPASWSSPDVPPGRSRPKLLAGGEPSGQRSGAKAAGTGMPGAP
jgi:hypothetical protein